MIVAFVQLLHELKKIGIWRQFTKNALLVVLITVETKQALFHVLLCLLLILFTIVWVTAAQVEGVTYQHRFYFLIKRARTAQRGRYVDFQEPGFELRVEQDVETVQLEANIAMLGASLHCRNDMRLDRLQGFNDHIFDTIHDCCEIDATSFKMCLQLGQVPLACVLIRASLILSTILTCVLHIVLILLIDRVVGQMYELRVCRLLIVRVLLSRESYQALLEEVDL